MPETRSRLYALDALRLVAALAVVLHHWLTVTPAEVKALSIYPEAFAWHAGYFGVATFFVISGLVILMSARGATAREFVFARAIRLYPAFWICASLTWLVCWNSPDAVDRAEYVLNLTMFPGAAGVRAVDGVYWTLAVEARFYLLIALLLAMNRLQRIEVVLWGWLALDLLVSEARIRGLLALNWAPFFVAGCACYLLRERFSLSRWVLLAAGTGAAVLASVEQAAVHVRVFRVPNETLAFALCAVAMVGLILLIALSKVRLPRSRAVVVAGAMSYPLYLLHKEIGWNLLKQWEHLPGLALFGAALGGVLLMAWAVAHYLEPVAQRVLRGFSTRNIDAA